MNPAETNQFIDVGMALGTYVMGNLAEQGYPLTVSMGTKLKQASIIDMEKIVGETAAKLLLDRAEAITAELAGFIEEQDRE